MNGQQWEPTRTATGGGDRPFPPGIAAPTPFRFGFSSYFYPENEAASSCKSAGFEMQRVPFGTKINPNQSLSVPPLLAKPQLPTTNERKRFPCKNPPSNPSGFGITLPTSGDGGFAHQMDIHQWIFFPPPYPKVAIKWRLLPSEEHGVMCVQTCHIFILF